MHQDYCEIDFPDDDTDNEAAPCRDDSQVCNRHHFVSLDHQGRCHLCDLLRGKNMKFTKGRF